MSALIWSEDYDAKLKAMWDAGHTVNSIAKELKITRNMVSGRKHRMGLDNRGTPIKKGDGPAKRPSAGRRKRPRQVMLPFKDARIDARPKKERAPSSHPRRSNVQTVDIPENVRMSKTDLCSWLNGEPSAFDYCDAPCIYGRSYCPKHLSISYRTLNTHSFQCEVTSV